MANANLRAAKRAKNDEFYTQYQDIQKEMNAYLDYNKDVFRGKTILLPCDDPEWSNFTKFFVYNFKTFGLKKLISTSYAFDSKGIEKPEPVDIHGKVFILTEDENNDNRIDINDLNWHYLEGDGDFRSDEVKKLRDEADIIITNPPFSLFREFLAWIVEAGKQFSIIGNINAITYKEVFPLIKNNQIWCGRTEQCGLWFFTINEDDVDAVDGRNMKKVPAMWFTNIDYGRRNQPLPLLTMAQNLKFSRHKKLRGKPAYEHYDNYDAIEVPYTDAIPSDYDGVMGVPISFLDKYCPEQFEILGVTQRNDDPYKIKKYTTDQYPNANDLNARGVIIRNGKPKSMYARILIQKIPDN